MQPITDSARGMINTVYADLLNTKKKYSFLIQESCEAFGSGLL
jgi:hypothetical protein